MSVQQSVTRTRSSPKQGPLRATMPISSFTKEGSGLCRSTSPNVSPSYQAPEYGLGRRSPGAGPPCTKGKSGGPIRRTSSLDTVYLKGLFPRESVFWHVDRATQTDHSTSLDSLQNLGSPDFTENRLARLSVRQRRRSCSRESSTDDQAANASSQTRSVSSPISRSPAPASKSSRSSEEGLNQEIESYISRSESDPHCDRLKEPTPEGRKAPVADILLRNIPYLRPAFQPSATLNSPDPTVLDSVSPVSCTLDTSHLETEGSQGSSPDQDNIAAAVSSPRINIFSARAPPDGCERILSKSVPILRPIPVEVNHPRSFFTLKPSSHSAFESLHREVEGARQQSSQTEEDTPTVPNQDHN